MNPKNVFPTIMCLLMIFACQKEVTIHIPTPKTQPIFIEGILFPNDTPKIFISQSNPFFSRAVTPQAIFARGAEVTISDGTTIDKLHPDSTFHQFRCRWEPFYGGVILPATGKTYTLEINYKDQFYTASTTLNQRKVKIDSIEYTPEFYDVYGGHDGVIIRLKDSIGVGDNYRFRMDRMITTSVFHAHVLDGLLNDCTQPDELFRVVDIGREVFSDKNIDGQNIEMYIEVSYEYSEGDQCWVFIQSLDNNAAAFYKNLDDQLVSIGNPFVEPIFINTKIPGAIGVFGSGILSDSLLFVYPQDNP